MGLNMNKTCCTKLGGKMMFKINIFNQKNKEGGCTETPKALRALTWE